MSVSPKSTQRRVVEAFTQDKVVLASLLFLIALYLVTALAGFLAPYAETVNDKTLAYAPPTPVFVVDHGHPVWPYVMAYHRQFDPNTYAFGFVPDYKHHYPLRFFVQGDDYPLFWGILHSHWHLFGVKAPGRLFLLGTDINGQDNFSRVLYGGQISLTIGFLGLLVAFPIGLLYGGISGYLGAGASMTR